MIAPSVLGNNSTQAKRSEMELTDESNPLEHLDITKYLVIKKPDEEGPDIRGGHPDALIIHATKANKNGEISDSHTDKHEGVFFWDVAPCCLVDIDQHFRGFYCLHHMNDDGGSKLL